MIEGKFTFFQISFPFNYSTVTSIDCLVSSLRVFTSYQSSGPELSIHIPESFPHHLDCPELTLCSLDSHLLHGCPCHHCLFKFSDQDIFLKCWLPSQFWQDLYSCCMHFTQTHGHGFQRSDHHSQI